MVLAGNVLGGGKVGGYPEGAKIYNSANILTTSGVTKVLTYDTERYDTNDFHSLVSNTDRITINEAGIYIITANVTFASNPNGWRELNFYASFGRLIGKIEISACSTNITSLPLTTIYEFAKGEYFNSSVRQSSGVNVNINAGLDYSPELAIHRIG